MIDEAAAFRELQKRLDRQFEQVWWDPLAPRTVVVVPSLTLDQEVLARITGIHHYEERMLCLLLLLRMPRTRVIYLSSTPIPEVIVDYYLHLLPSVPAHHARARLTMLSCHDSSVAALTDKILARPRMIQRLRQAIAGGGPAHMSCFTVCEAERTLALRLGIPIFGCDPDLLPLGSKSGSRKMIREAGVAVPEGFEDLYDAHQVADALTELRARKPGLRRAVVKLNEGFSGEGNAVFRFDTADPDARIRAADLPGLAFEAKDMTWEIFNAKIGQMGSIVEEFIEGDVKRSPSAQFRIFPGCQVETISTHDQDLSGDSGQIFVGCLFPADDDYRLTIQALGKTVADRLCQEGVLGRLGVDFISVLREDGWHHYGIEINLRKGGTTHPFLMLQFLVDGSYDAETGHYRSRHGLPCFYYATDNLQGPDYEGLTPADVIDIAVDKQLHFHSASQEGVAFHLIGATSEFGKLGMVCVARTPEDVRRLYEETVASFQCGAGNPG